MRVISDGNRYDIYPNNIDMFDKLPTSYYDVKFSEREGFYLTKHPDFEKTEEKVYGPSEQRVKKVFSSFSKSNRNLGVILSGDKGIGKSLTARMMCMEAVLRGYPVILVNNDYPGLADFIGNIDEEVVVLFDEFDKTFTTITRNLYNNNPVATTEKQSTLLGLFDGIYSGKKLFIITCNELRNLSSLLLNRTGRFHYHFQFEYPGDDEITLYMKDKLDPKYYGEIKNVIAFSRRTQLNYDTLRSIAFELNMGYHFDEMINDLNIINLDEVEYEVFIHLKNGQKINANTIKLDLLGENDLREIYKSLGPKDDVLCYLYFKPSSARFDKNDFVYKIYAKDIEVHTSDYDEDDPAVMDFVDNFEVEYISFRRVKNRGPLYYL